MFVRFLERADTFEDRGVPLITWLFRLARNLSIDLQRRQGRTIPFSAMVLADFSTDDGQTHLTRLAERQELRLALASLPPIYRQVLLLRVVYHLPLPETARQLGRTLGATKALQTRAVQLLRERMGSDDQDGERIPSPPMA